MNDYLAALNEVWSGHFWVTWTIVIIAINYGTMLFLLMWAPWAKIGVDKHGTTGHSWSNGRVQEGLAHLPLWWFAISTAAFIFFIFYLILYPSFGGYSGLLDWSSHKQHDEHRAKIIQEQQPIWDAVENNSILELTENKEVLHLGRRLFEDNCAACHGYDAKGMPAVGAPNLTDNTWLYGGTPDAIVHSITKGRHGVMPPWKSSYDEDQIEDIANYVLSLSDSAEDTESANRGEPLFKGTCAACHGKDGTGNQALGAPNLADDVWKYGGDLDTVIETITDGRKGHMPAWNDRLNDKEIKVLAAWVLSHDNTEQARQ